MKNKFVFTTPESLHPIPLGPSASFMDLDNIPADFIQSEIILLKMTSKYSLLTSEASDTLGLQEAAPLSKNLRMTSSSC